MELLESEIYEAEEHKGVYDVAIETNIRSFFIIRTISIRLSVRVANSKLLNGACFVLPFDKPIACFYPVMEIVPLINLYQTMALTLKSCRLQQFFKELIKELDDRSI
jgi:hypothetical protein